jgi:hypothetical protein
MLNAKRGATSARGDHRTSAWRPILILAGLVLAPALANAAPKTDVVTLKNGDRITGEVKVFEQGKLTLKTDAAGTIYIEWDKVATLQTNQYLQVELVTGARRFGQAPLAAEEGVLHIQSDLVDRGWDLHFADVVRIDPIDRGDLLTRLDGYVTAGYNYTKANSLQQFTFTGGLNARTRTYQWSVDGSSTLNRQQGDERDSSRWSASAAYRHFLRDRWFLQGFGGFEGNDELGLDLRSTVGGAIGRYLVHTNQQDWGAYVGLAYTRESYAGKAEEDGAEAVLGTQYSFFRYDTPEASFDAQFNLLPSLTQSGRIRADASLRSRYEIIKDLFFEVSVYGNYDSDPGAEALSNSDYGLTTSLGYSF